VFYPSDSINAELDEIRGAGMRHRVGGEFRSDQHHDVPAASGGVPEVHLDDLTDSSDTVGGWLEADPDRVTRRHRRPHAGGFDFVGGLRASAFETHRCGIVTSAVASNARGGKAASTT
jgi:hypothetical protein